MKQHNIPQPHGNDKSENPRQYRRTLPSTIADIRNKGRDKQPSKIYKEIVVNRPVPGIYQSVKNTRNTEQVRNRHRLLRKETRLTHDQIYRTLELAYHLDGVVHEIAIYPDFYCIVAHPEVTSELNKVLMVKSDATALLSYDATFNIGDFYVSILVFRHVLFQGGVTIPAAFIIHDRKCSDVHDRFWRKLIQIVPNLKKNCPVIVTDRESALNNAIKSYLPNAKIVHCWNHIRRDIKQWLRTHDGKTDDMSVYPANIVSLLQTEDLNAFETLYTTLALNWSKPFDEYFNANLRQELLDHSVRWV
jgi:hypothetical protein